MSLRILNERLPLGRETEIFGFEDKDGWERNVMQMYDAPDE